MIALEDAATLHNNLANVYRDWGKVEQAIAEYSKAIEMEPAAVNPYANLASFYLAQGQTDKAEEVVKRGLDKVGAADRDRLERLREQLPEE
jgi:Flp pilus assembly protein TadD